jgi:hypothetical protein
MKRHGHQPAVRAASIDPDLERRWQEALLERPSDPRELAAWDAKYGDLLSAYQRAVERAQTQEQQLKSGRARLRRRAVAAAACMMLAIGGAVYLVNRPSVDEIRTQEIQRLNVACDTHYSQTHHLKLVNKQIDLLTDGEGGWLDLYAYPGESPKVGGVDLSPAELLAGKTGQARVDREAYVYDSTLGIGSLALLERRGDKLVLTLFADLSGYGELPHASLVGTTSTAVTAQGEQLSSACWQ